MAATDVLEDIISLVVIRIFAKRKKGEISRDDFTMIADTGFAGVLGIVTNRPDKQVFEDIMTEEIRKAVELISKRTCGLCGGSGMRGRQGFTFVICRCVHMVHYRGDTLLPVGEQYSNEYFHGEFSKDELGRKNTVKNIASAVMLFLTPR
ncbi:MAG: hypothetical protein GTN93_09620 [Anaerolineae bacterium]|nr:hypothetical protein [Anaerolineae bacterium]